MCGLRGAVLSRQLARPSPRDAEPLDEAGVEFSRNLTELM